MFKDIKSRKKPFVILQFLLFFSGLFIGGTGVYMDNAVYLGWMFWLVCSAFLLRGLEEYLTRMPNYIWYFFIGILYLSFSLFIYPIW